VIANTRLLIHQQSAHLLTIVAGLPLPILRKDSAA